ncbi:ferritin heavy chain [Cylas formicarius]|uniref:ferritin heavy chain n=1 Tax=Cylas formicarius TaxID=197179 RepID=UPI0029586D82|nr:ferritin heavy chain [Cylas formicarius]
MKIIAGLVLLCVAVTSAQLQCEHRKPKVPTDWLDMVDPCVEKMRSQVMEELKAAMQYMAMGAHFSKDSVNRLGFSKLFFEAASEEREHAIKLISYLLMRGELTSKVSDLIKRSLSPQVSTWDSGISALRDALKLEASVTKKIRDVIITCENAPSYNDYHLVDYLTGEFLEEQYKGQRDLAGKVSTLDKMMDKHGALGEYLFDKKLLSGDL